MADIVSFVDGVHTDTTLSKEEKKDKVLGYLINYRNRGKKF